MAGRDVDPRFGERMRELMQQRGTSYRALAARARFTSTSALHRLANSHTTADPDIAQRLDEALGAGGKLAELATAAPATVDVRAPVGDTDDVMRRTLLTAIAALGVDQASTEPAIGHLLAGLAEQGQQWSTADDWREAAWEYGYAYLTQPRVETLRDATADLAALQMLLPQARGSRRAGLHDAGARLAGLVAMACTDLGHQREARHTWRMARRLAAGSQSIDCAMWVRGQEVTIGLYSGRPLPALLALADEGLRIGDRAPVGGYAELLGARAQTLTRLGRADEALAALEPLRATVDALPESVTCAADSIYGFPPHRLRHAESFVRATAGGSALAHQAHDAAIAAVPQDRLISRCQIELHRSARLVRDGLVRDGVAHAHAQVATLPGDKRGRFVLALVDTVVASVPSALSQMDDVHALRDLAAA